MPTNPLDVMKQYAAREAEQFALLEKQPLQELVGVLTPRGIGGVQTSGRPWMLVVFVSAWRLDDGPVHERELRLLGPMAERTINKLQDATKGFEIVRMRVRMLPPDRPTPEKGDPSPPDGLIVEWQGVVTDEALAPVATRLAKPVVVVDPVLGTLTLDRGLGRFDGKVKWGASEARLSIDGVGKKPAAKGLAAARDVVARGAHWEKLARDGAVKDLFETWEENWREDGPKLTEAAFAAMLTVSGISVTAGGAPTLWLNDGDLFAGHEVMVAFTPGGKVKDVDIVG